MIKEEMEKMSSGKQMGNLAKKASEASTGKGTLSSLASKAKPSLASKAKTAFEKKKKPSETTDFKGKHRNISMA